MLYHSCILTDSVKLQQESSANICETSLGICKKSNRKFVNDTKIWAKLKTWKLHNKVKLWSLTMIFLTLVGTRAVFTAFIASSKFSSSSGMPSLLTKIPDGRSKLTRHSFFVRTIQIQYIREGHCQAYSVILGIPLKLQEESLPLMQMSKICPCQTRSTNNL